MSKPSSIRAPVVGAAGTNRRNRRRRQAARRGDRPYFRAKAALDATFRLIGRTERTIASSEWCAAERPVRTCNDLHNASARLVAASQKLGCAARRLAEVNKCILREPERSLEAPGPLTFTTECWVLAAGLLQQTSDRLVDLQEAVLAGLESGELVPEPESAPRE